MIKKSIVGLLVCLLFVTNAWAQTTYVLDTGDPSERVCNPKSYTDLGNGIVRDNVTGLEWQKASAPGSFYSWQDALDYVAGMNAGTYENYGHTDWRLPTIKELSTLIDAGQENPAINTNYFPDTSALCYYWSSTTCANNISNAWIQEIGFGSVYDSHKNFDRCVRAVRGGLYGPFSNFVSNSNGTVTDTITDLMWQQCNYGQTWDGTQCTGTAGTRNWEEAVAYIQGLNDSNYFGHEDWRLPTRNELQSLVDYSRYNPATAFPYTESNYWSSTNYSIISGALKWSVTFVDGIQDGLVDGNWTGNNFYVRAVRGGLCWIDTAECLADSDCAETEGCRDNVCVCKLLVTHKQISAEKLTKPRKVVLNVTSANETFDIFSLIDLGPLTWKKLSFNRKKGMLKIHAIVPAGLDPGSYPISVGDCSGEVVITGTDR